MSRPDRPLRFTRPRATCAALALASATLIPGCAATGSLAAHRHELRLLVPSEDGAANDDHPRLAWTGLGVDAASYRVSVFADEARARPIESTTVTEPSVTLSASYDDGQRVYVRVEAFDSSGSPLGAADSRFHVVPIPYDVPRAAVTISDPQRRASGYTLFNVQDPLPPEQDQRVAALLVVNAHGEIVWWRRFPPGFVTDAWVGDDGRLRYVYSPNGGPSQAFESSWDGAPSWTSRDGTLVHHDVRLGPEDRYLYLTTVVRDVLGTPFEGDGIELVDPATNQVTWSWNIFDHVPVTDFNAIDLVAPGVNGQGQDWTHCNALAWDPKRKRIWLSVRNLSRLLAIDYPSGEVRATIGESGLGGDALMDHQHAPELEDDGSILYFDNGLDRGWSRVAGFTWDEQAGTVSQTFDWRDDSRFYDPALGDVDRLPDGHLLITSGVGGTLLGKPARLIEISAEGEKLWQLELGSGARLGGYWIYRAQRLDERQLPAAARPFG